MSQAYSYDVAATTANAKINVGILVQEILDAGLGGGGNPIEQAAVTGATNELSGLLAGGTFTVTFTNALSAPEKTTLDATVAAHTGQQYAGNPSFKSNAGPVTENAGTYTSALGGSLDVGPIAEGYWRIEYAMEVKVQAPPASGADRVETQLLDNVGSVLTGDFRSTDTYTDITGQIVKYYQAGQTLAIDLQFRKAGAGVVAEVKDAQVVLTMLVDT